MGREMCIGPEKRTKIYKEYQQNSSKEDIIEEVEKEADSEIYKKRDT